jgi:hypothetical protein
MRHVIYAQDGRELRFLLNTLEAYGIECPVVHDRKLYAEAEDVPPRVLRHIRRLGYRTKKQKVICFCV